MAVLRAVVPDWVGIIDGDDKGLVGRGAQGGQVARVDAIGSGVAWFIEADGLRNGVVLVDDMVRWVYDDSLVQCCVKQARLLSCGRLRLKRSNLHLSRS